MKKFIIQIAVFICLFFAGVLSILYIQGSFIRRNADFTLDPDVKYIILGNSHAETAYNDSLIQNFKNLASSGESYFYSYVKLKEVLAQNSQIEVVFVEFTNLSVMASNDRWIWGKEYMNNRFADFNAFIDFEGAMLLARKNFLEFVNSGSLAMRTNMEVILDDNYNFQDKLGEYNYLERFKTDSLLKNSKQLNKNQINEKLKKSVYGVIYLKKIVELCKSKDVEIVLIRTPLHKLSNERVNEDIFEELRLTMFTNVKFIDNINFNLENEEFGDLEHLNFKGASKYSKWFNENVILKFSN